MKGMRCGDLNAANSILQQFGGSNSNGEDMGFIDPAVSDIVSQLAQFQQTQETIFGNSGNTNTTGGSPTMLQSSLLNPTQTMIQSRRQVADLYERTKTRSQQSSADTANTISTLEQQYTHYRLACLAMLGGSESISEVTTLESSGLVNTVEDYLYASLWHALHLVDDASSSDKEVCKD